METIKIPPSELEIMKVIWNSEQPISSKFITTKLEEIKGYKTTTTLTLLSRLVKKGALSDDKRRKWTYYTSNIEKEDYQLYATQNFIKTMFDKDIEELKRVLNKIEQSQQF